MQHQRLVFVKKIEDDIILKMVSYDSPTKKEIIRNTLQVQTYIAENIEEYENILVNTKGRWFWAHKLNTYDFYTNETELYKITDLNEDEKKEALMPTICGLCYCLENNVHFIKSYGVLQLCSVESTIPDII